MLKRILGCGLIGFTLIFSWVRFPAPVGAISSSATPLARPSATTIPITQIMKFAVLDTNEHVVLLDGKTQTDLTQKYGEVRLFQWSPDCLNIAFVTSASGQDIGYHDDDEIHIVNINTGQISRLTYNNYPETTMMWSPDGKRIAFGAQSKPDGNVELWVVNDDGTGIQRLSQHDSQQRISLEITSIAWSVDGKYIAYTSGIGREGFDYTDLFQIYVVNAIGSDWQPLVRGRNVSWLANGKQLVYEDIRNDRNLIYLINADGSHEEAITDGTIPVPSPAGEWIVFVFRGDLDDAGLLYFYNINTSQLRQTRIDLHPVLALQADPSEIQLKWARGGKQIMFGADDLDNRKYGFHSINFHPEYPMTGTTAFLGMPCPW